MERLRQDDLRSVLRLLREVYAFQDLDSFRQATVHGVSRLIDGGFAGYSEMSPTERASRNLSWPPGIYTADREEPWHRLMHQHPILANYLTTADGRACRISDFMTRRQFRQTGLYCDVYRAMEVEDELAIALKAPNSLVIGIGIHRDRCDFSERERRLLDLVRPHLSQAYFNARSATALGRAVTDDGAGGGERELVLLDGSGRMRKVSDRASGWLAAYAGAQHRESRRAPPAIVQWMSRESSRLSSVNGVGECCRPLVLQSASGRLVVRLLLSHPYATLILEQHRERPDPQSLRKLGLTPREAEVLRWVAEGKSNGDIAVILGNRPATVSKHLERIYQKLGVETRTAAARLAILRRD